MSGSLAANMLRLYRQNSPLEMAEQAKEFRRLSDKDRDELLWWMIMHANVALNSNRAALLLKLSTTLSVAFAAMPRARRYW